MRTVTHVSNIAHGPLVLEDVFYIVMCFEYIYGQACKLYDVCQIIPYISSLHLLFISDPCSYFEIVSYNLSHSLPMAVLFRYKPGFSQWAGYVSYM